MMLQKKYWVTITKYNNNVHENNKKEEENFDDKDLEKSGGDYVYKEKEHLLTKANYAKENKATNENMIKQIENHINTKETFLSLTKQKEM